MRPQRRFAPDAENDVRLSEPTTDDARDPSQHQNKRARALAAAFGALLAAALFVLGPSAAHGYCAATGETPSCPNGRVMCSYPRQTCADGKPGWACFPRACPAVPGFRSITPAEAGGNGYPKTSALPSPSGKSPLVCHATRQ